LSRFSLDESYTRPFLDFLLSVGLTSLWKIYLRISISYNHNNNSSVASTPMHVQASNSPRRTTLKYAIEARTTLYDGRILRQGPTTRAMAKHIHDDWNTKAHIRPKILSNWSSTSL